MHACDILGFTSNLNNINIDIIQILQKFYEFFCYL